MNRDKKGRFVKGHKTNIGKHWIVSPEMRKNMGRKKGCITWMKGKKHTLESKINNSLSNLGRKKSPNAHAWSKVNHPPNYKGGITPITVQLRNCKKYKIWRNRVFEKDNYICQNCKARSGNGKRIVLNAHHNKLFSKIIEENNIKSFEDGLLCKELWDINNGITHCIDCHELTKQGGAT